MTAGPGTGIALALSTSSCYPEPTAACFAFASRLGYDGVEVMVYTDPVSQDVAALRQLVEHYGVPVLAVHVPCLLVTQRVWGTDGWGKLVRSVDLAEELGAGVVVVHPPFVWQRAYARGFVEGLARLQTRTAVLIAVENMYPWRAGRAELPAYAPGWDPTPQAYPYVTLDLSHTAASGSDPLAMMVDLGPRLRHVHLADGSGAPRDEHLVPGRGTQHADLVLSRLVATGWSGTVVVEVNTRRSSGRPTREPDLAESLAFARQHLAQAPPPTAVAVHPRTGRHGLMSPDA